LGLLVWFVAGRTDKPGSWQVALVEATGDVTPATLAFMVMLAVFILYPQAQSSDSLQILFIFVLPLLLGWIFFHGPLLSLATQRGYLRTLGQRLPAAWVAANLGMSGIFALAMLLVNWVTTTCSLMPLSPWTVVSLWTMVAAAASLAILLTLIYEGWAVRRGFRAWSILALGEGEVTTPSWRKLWWWILLSIVVLVGGVIASQLLQ
jgi:hypothetical protein